MKYYLLFLSIFFVSMNTLFSQTENNEQKYANVSMDLTSNTFTFSHDVDYFEDFENRLITELNNNKIILESLSIDNYICEVVFIEELSIADCKENLHDLVRKLNFDGFTIK